MGGNNATSTLSNTLGFNYELALKMPLGNPQKNLAPTRR